MAKLFTELIWGKLRPYTVGEEICDTSYILQWLGMHKDNLANICSKLCTDIEQSPSIILERF